MTGNRSDREPSRLALFLSGVLAGLALPLGSYLAIAIGIERIVGNITVAEMATVFCFTPGLFLGPIAGAIVLPKIYNRNKAQATLAQSTLRVGVVGFAVGLALPFLFFGALLLLSM